MRSLHTPKLHPPSRVAGPDLPVHESIVCKGRASTAHVPYPCEYDSGWLIDSMTSELDHKTFTTHGHLRTYLGFAPGVGKTYRMLAEGRRRAERGERVVIGWIERHGRTETKAQLRDLEVIAPRQALYRGSAFSELDVDGVLASGAKVVLLDELAHRVPAAGPGSVSSNGYPMISSAAARYSWFPWRSTLFGGGSWRARCIPRTGSAGP